MIFGKYHYIWKADYEEEFFNISISIIDPTIKLPTEINSIEELRNALKENISFTVFKNTNVLICGPNSLWKIKFDKELATYTDISITLHTQN
ncbi:hypothetical protein RhiirA1_471095 [Rhizophagus irregularis]|uniref:Uncharacterized protein n=1 Tax=Rhizophagus irregularis TaxID=588596 RepID=A0A2N0R4X2_9GLOM|nr:hypothetical protein RhiirA1_471095 [Rhizophagus irregularis]